MPDKTANRPPPDAWKVRWCGACSGYEFDTGVPRGWVRLQGNPPPEKKLLPHQRRMGSRAPGHYDRGNPDYF